MVNWAQKWVDFKHWYGVHTPAIHKTVKYTVATAAVVGVGYYFLHNRDHSASASGFVAPSDVTATSPTQAHGTYFGGIMKPEPTTLEVKIDTTLKNYTKLPGDDRTYATFKDNSGHIQYGVVTGLNIPVGPNQKVSTHPVTEYVPQQAITTDGSATGHGSLDAR